MEPSPPEPALAPWLGPQGSLGGSLSARPRGLIAPEFVLLDRDGEEFGRMVVHGPQGARLDAGSIRARIERVADPGSYRMLTGEAETLVAQPAGSSVAMKIRCAGRPYEAAFDLLRNTAAAGPVGGGETARLTGGLLRRGYEVLFDAGDGRSLPIALFLLYYTVTLRRRTFLTGPPGNRERRADR